jgi:hypothetical protein
MSTGVAAGRQARARHTLPRILARWAIGKHWHGRALSDGSFWRDGMTCEPAWFAAEPFWRLWAGWKRAAVRLVLAVALAGLWRWRTGTEWALAFIGGPVLGLLIWRVVMAVRFWRHHRELERPLALKLAPYLGTSPRAVEAALTIDPGFESAEGGEHVGALELPDHWAATRDQQRPVEEIIGNQLGIELQPKWKTASYPMVLNLVRAPTPPREVLFADWRARIEELPLDKVMVGVGADGEPRDWDRSAEDPAIAIHGGSRRGKTNLLLLIAAQERHKWRLRPLPEGAPDYARGRVTYIDPKQVSAIVLGGVPGVDLCNQGARDIEGMWAGMARFAGLVNARYDALAVDNTLEFQDALLILDELSMFSGMSARHWAAVRERSDPPEPPPWAHLATVVWMGAQVRARAIVAGQRLDYRILAGLLGSFGIRMMAGFLPQDYMRLVGVLPVPRSQKPRGRFLMFAGEEPEWVQVPFAKPEEYRTWMLTDGPESASDLAGDLGHGTWDSVVGHAAAAQYLELSLDAFRQRLKRQGRPAGEYKIGNQPAWRRADLDLWAGRETVSGRREATVLGLRLADPAGPGTP